MTFAPSCLSITYQGTGVSGNHQVFVSFYHMGGDPARRCADAGLMLPVSLLVQFQSKPAARPANGVTHRRRILADTCGENDPVEAAERRGERADLAGRAIVKDLECKSGAWLLARQQLAEIR